MYVANYLMQSDNKHHTVLITKVPWNLELIVRNMKILLIHRQNDILDLARVVTIEFLYIYVGVL